MPAKAKGVAIIEVPEAKLDEAKKILREHGIIEGPADNGAKDENKNLTHWVFPFGC